MAITEEKLNLLLTRLRKKFPTPNYLIHKDDVIYQILVDDEELANSPSFLDYFFQENIEIFGDNSSYVTLLYDYFHRIPSENRIYQYAVDDRKEKTLSLKLKGSQITSIYYLEDKYAMSKIQNTFGKHLNWGIA